MGLIPNWASNFVSASVSDSQMQSYSLNVNGPLLSFRSNTSTNLERIPFWTLDVMVQKMRGLMFSEDLLSKWTQLLLVVTVSGCLGSNCDEPINSLNFSNIIGNTFGCNLNFVLIQFLSIFCFKWLLKLHVTDTLRTVKIRVQSVNIQWMCGITDHNVRPLLSPKILPAAKIRRQSEAVTNPAIWSCVLTSDIW